MSDYFCYACDGNHKTGDYPGCDLSQERIDDLERRLAEAKANSCAGYEAIKTKLAIAEKERDVLREKLAGWTDRFGEDPSPLTKLELRVRVLMEILELIAAPVRSDGTWNRDREACRKLALDALAKVES